MVPDSAMLFEQLREADTTRKPALAADERRVDCRPSQARPRDRAVEVPRPFPGPAVEGVGPGENLRDGEVRGELVVRSPAVLE